MRYVLDASVALKWVLREQDSPRAIRLRHEYQNGHHELIAPDNFSLEVAHALAKAERRGIIPAAQGTILLTSVLSTPPQFFPYLPLLLPAFAIASRAWIGVYDCLYVALAEREGCDLLTADDRLAKALPASPIVLLSTLP